MDEILRQRLWRHIEALPEAQIYQVLDYIEFLASKYAREPVRGPTSSVQRFGERLQDKLRTQNVGLRAMQGTLEAVGTADRMFSGLAEAGRSIIREVEAGFRADPEARETHTPPRSLPPRTGSAPESRSPGPRTELKPRFGELRDPPASGSPADDG